MSRLPTFHFYSVIFNSFDTLEGINSKTKGKEFICKCPFHKDGKEKKPSFGIDLETGLYNCFTCGEKGNIVSFVSKMRKISEDEAKQIVMNEVGFIDINQIPYSMEEFSREKKLPVKFLDDNGVDSLHDMHIAFPYYDQEHNMVRVKYRNHPDSQDRFFWNYGDKMTLYGVWKISTFEKDFIILVEGETDALSLWYHNIPALGVPGANNFKKEYAKFFEDFGKVYIHIEKEENDTASKNFMKKICQSGIPYEKLYKFSARDINEKCKDPSDLHIQDLLDKDTLLNSAKKIDKDYFDEVNKGQKASEQHVKIAEQVLEQMYIKFFKGNFYIYQNGVYREGLSMIEKSIISIDKNLKKSVRGEILDYIRISENVEIIELDKNIINFKNGIYHIDTDTLQPHSPEIFTLCQINAEYLNDDELQELQQEGKNIDIDTFFAGISCNKTARANALQEFLGYSMTYDVSLQKCLFLYGPTANNGKSTFNELLINLIGENNWCSISIGEFSERFSGSDLSNKLVNVVHELESVTLRDVAKFKSAISGDIITVEEKYKPRYAMKPFAHHIFAMNSLPDLKNCSDKGYFRRIHIIPFNAKFTSQDKNEFNFDKLITIDSLNYLANICLRKYLKMRQENRRNFSNTEESNSLIEVYKSTNNSALLFLSNELNFKHLLTKKNKVEQRDLFKDYENWCYAHDLEAFNKKDFKKAVFESNKFRSTTPHNGYDCYEYMQV